MRVAIDPNLDVSEGQTSPNSRMVTAVRFLEKGFVVLPSIQIWMLVKVKHHRIPEW